MYLKVYANHMKGVQVKATINLQCNSPSQKTFKCLLQTEIGMTGGVYIDTNLADIHKEMCELLLDKQMNVQNDSLKKNFWVLCKLPQAHEKSIQ